MILIREALLRRFPIDEIVTIQPVQTGPSSVAWQVLVRRGADCACWFVKKHRRAGGLQLRFELELAAALADDGAAALIPPVIPTTDGSLSFVLGEDAYSAQIFVDADPPVDWMLSNLSHPQLQSGGAALAMFHHAARKLNQKCPDLVRQASLSVLPQLEEHFAASQASALAQLPQSDPLRVSLQRAHDQLMLCLGNAVRQAAGVDREHSAELIHGDYHPGNVLWRGARAAAIVDLEFAHLETLSYDVANGAYMFCRRFTDPAVLANPSLDSNRLSAFVEAYNEQAFRCGQPVVGEELQAFINLPPFLVADWSILEYVSKPIMREALGPVIKSVLKDALTPIECRPPRLYS